MADHVHRFHAVIYVFLSIILFIDEFNGRNVSLFCFLLLFVAQVDFPILSNMDTFQVFRFFHLHYFLGSTFIYCIIISFSGFIVHVNSLRNSTISNKVLLFLYTLPVIPQCTTHSPYYYIHTTHYSLQLKWLKVCL